MVWDLICCQDCNPIMILSIWPRETSIQIWAWHRAAFNSAWETYLRVWISHFRHKNYIGSAYFRNSSCLLREAMLLFWDEDTAFLGHTKWSTKHSGNNQRGTVKDTPSQVLEAVNISAPVPTPLSLSLSAHRSWYTSIVHPVLTSRVYFFFSFHFI